MGNSNINPNIMSSMMRYDDNKDGKLSGSELKAHAKKFNNSDSKLIKDIIDHTTNSKELTPQDKANLTKFISSADSIEPKTIIFDRVGIQKQKQALVLKSHNENSAILSGKNSKYVGLSDKATAEKYLAVMSKFKVRNLQPMSAPLSEMHRTVAGSGSPRSDSDLKDLYMSNLTESKQANGKSLNDNFRDRIINSPKSNLDIADVLGVALEVTNGDYALAVATASNVFKSAAYELRGVKNPSDGKSRFFTKEFSGDSEDFTKDLKMINKLGNLRKNNNGDKMGMWYHFFSIQSAASYFGEHKTNAGITAEHLSRNLKPAYQAIKNVFSTNNALSPVDSEKAHLDNLSLDVFNNVMERFKG